MRSAVPVFRDDAGQQRNRPSCRSLITAPAARNANVVLRRDPTRADEVRRAMAERIERVLALAADRGHTAVVLGAWGCGAFGCDVDMVANEFQRAFARRFAGVFEHVVFAILDTSRDRRFVGPFERSFAAA